MSRRAVLIVDRNEEERRIVARYLEFVGGIVLEAGSGEAGVEVAVREAPDLILLELSMPGMDGWETLRRLRSDPATAQVPVLALASEPLDREPLEQAGFCGCLEKPVTPFRVLREVELCIGRLDGSGPARVQVPPDPRESGQWARLSPLPR